MAKYTGPPVRSVSADIATIQQYGEIVDMFEDLIQDVADNSTGEENIQAQMMLMGLSQHRVVLQAMLTSCKQWQQQYADDQAPAG